MLKKKFGKGLLLLLAFVMVVSMCFFAYGDFAMGKNKGRVGQTETQANAQATNLGLFGGQAEDIAVDGTSDNVYITTMAPDGLFTSFDQGENWSGLSSSSNYGTGKQVEVDQSTGDVYVLIGDSLLKSADKGVSFSDITSNIGAGDVLGQALLFARGYLLVALGTGGGSAGNLAISSDGGASFNIVNVGTGAQLGAFAAAVAGNTFYASLDEASSNIYQSIDNGATWSDFALPESMQISAMAVDPADSSHIVLGSSTGSTSKTYSKFGAGAWTELLDNGNAISANCITFDGAGRLYIMQSYSDDNGVTWTQMTIDTPLSSIYADHFAIDPNNVNVLFTNSVYSVAKSIDQGASWSDEANGIASVKVYDITQANSKGIVWIAANGGLGKTTNFTASSPDWVYPVSGTGGASAYAVWVNPADPNIILYGDHNQIKRSTDGGTSFTAMATIGPGPGNIVEIVSVPGDNNTLYAALKYDDLAGTDYGYVYKSTDMGASWTNTNLPGNAPVDSLTVAKNGAVYAGCSSNDSEATKGVYKYNGTWSRKTKGIGNKPVTSILADTTKKKTVYATVNTDTGEGGNPAGSGFYKTENGGKKWVKAKKAGLKDVSNLDTLTVQTSTTPHTLYMAGQEDLNGVIYKSSDGGDNWGKYFEGLKQEQFYALMFDGLVAGNDRGLYEMKSRAKLKLKAKKKKVKKGKKVLITVTLKDKATKKKLKKKKIQILKKTKKKKKFKKLRVVKTNKKGKVKFKVKVKAKKRLFLKAKWKRKKKDKREYAVTKSKRRRIKVKK